LSFDQLQTEEQAKECDIFEGEINDPKSKIKYQKGFLEIKLITIFLQYPLTVLSPTTLLLRMVQTQFEVYYV
jgi:hypothetical protein